jgi:hypothetical protein
MIFEPLFMILVLTVVIAAAVVNVRSLGAPWQGTAAPHHLPQTAPRSICSIY